MLFRSAAWQFSTTVQLVHDACIQSLADVTPLNYQAAIPAVVYLNGEYWGIYNLRERKNKDMIYSYYGLSETDFDMIEFAWGPVVSNGSKENWNKFENIVRSSNFSKNEDYEKICELMDIDNFLYYMSIQIMGKNMDWPNNNQLVFCPHAKGGKWKWILQDLNQLVVVAKNDAVMPSGLIIKPSSLRGVESHGMLCSAKELALPNAPQVRGILILDENDYQVGNPFFK